MIPDDIEALALADAAGALEPDEQRELAQRIAALPSGVRGEIAHVYEATLRLAASAPPQQPSPAVRERLIAALRGSTNYTIPADAGGWSESGVAGIQVKILAVDRQRGLVTLLLRGEPGARYPAHRHSAPEECYVIRGSVTIGGRVLRAGDFHHADADSDHGAITTIDGADVLLIGGISDYLPAASPHDQRL
jgi:anti-sigma factor ChrR (cupin superfamily)